ncbi:MAG TPA: hypothetical protein VE907_15645 [Gammaproteobacteria bacterium]|nr:hypothetical protein [Gammaproteobacteria bacterium]
MRESAARESPGAARLAGSVGARYPSNYPSAPCHCTPTMLCEVCLAWRDVCRHLGALERALARLRAAGR